MTIQWHVAILLFLSLALSELANSLPTFNATAPTEPHSLSKRQCVKNPATGIYDQNHCDHLLPTLDEIVARIHDTSDGGWGTPAAAAVFYSNLALKERPSEDDVRKSAEWVLAWLTQRRSTGQQFYWWYEHLDVEWRKAQVEHVISGQNTFKATWGPNALETFDYCSYQALSAAALYPIAYVFLPRGATPKTPTWRPDSVWEHTEFWQLTKNPNVQKILRVDPRPWDVIKITPLEWCRWSEEQMLWERGVDPELEPRWQCPVYYDENGDPQ